MHDLIQSESLANQSRFRHERDQDMHHLREVIQSHLNQEIEGVHSRVKEWTTKETEAQARTRDVLLQHIDKVSHTPRVEKSANSFGDMGQVRFDTFSGKQSEDFAKFRKAVQRNFEFLEWDADRRARFLPTLLTNKALRVYETLAPNVTTEIDAVWRALDEHFSQKSKGVLHVHALIDRQQLKTESVENYANTMNECFDKYEITDEFVRMTYFVKGLRSEIKTQLLKRRPNTLNECEEYAQIIESADQQSSSLADAVSKLSLTSEPKRDTAKNQSNNPFCRFCGAKHKFGQHLRSFQRPQNRFRGGNTMPTQGARFPYRPRYSGSLSYRPRATFQPNPSTATGPRPIYQDIGFGTSRQNPPSTPPTRCFKCGNSGHLARQCRTRPLNT